MSSDESGEAKGGGGGASPLPASPAAAAPLVTPGLAEAALPELAALSELRRELARCGVAAGEFSDALQLVWLLSCRMLTDDGEAGSMRRQQSLQALIAHGWLCYAAVLCYDMLRHAMPCCKALAAEREASYAVAQGGTSLRRRFVSTAAWHSMLLRCYAATLLCCYATTLLCCYAAVLLCCYAAMLLCCYAARLLCCYAMLCYATLRL